VAAVALYGGQRQADVLGMLWTDIQEELIPVTQSKTGKKLWIPMHADLRAVLAEIPRVSVHVLTNSRRLPWTAVLKWQAASESGRTKNER
jgi:integrase